MPSASELRQVPLGLCEDYPEESRSLTGARRDLMLLRQIGIQTLRVSMGWDGIEPERDRYDFSFWDEFIAMAGELGITLIPYVAYTPDWSSGDGPAEHWKAPPRDPADFAEIMGLLAARYRSQIRSWELWNEPDNRDYWTGTVEQYAALVRAGASSIRAVDPEIRIVSGGLAGTIEFLSDLFDQPDLPAALDVVNLHSYYETWNPEPLETIPEYVARAQAIVERHAGQQDLWMAEVGYSNYRQGSRVSEYTRARFAHEHTLEFQAVALVRTLALLLGSPALSLVAWYELKDPPATDAMIGDVNNRHLGVVFADYRPKPALRALTLMARLFSDPFQAVDSRIRVRPAGSASLTSAAEVHAFVSARRTLIVIAWLTNAARGSGTGAGAGDEPSTDQRRESLQVTLPYRARGPAVQYDELGRTIDPKRLQAVSVRGQAETLLGLTLRAGDVVLLELPIELDD
jgi:glycosyl hydrolase family 39 (putative alpha-L-iduronidase)